MDFHLSQFLGRYTTLISPEKKIRESVRDAIQTTLHVDVPLSLIRYNKREVFLTVHPLVKRSVLEHEQEVLAHVERAFQKKLVVSIR